MKLSGGVEWALHCCVVLAGMQRPVPAARLAEFHDVSASYLAKQLQGLSRAGLVRSVQGQSDPDFPVANSFASGGTGNLLLKPGMVTGSRFELRSFRGKIHLKRP